MAHPNAGVKVQTCARSVVGTGWFRLRCCAKSSWLAAFDAREGGRKLAAKRHFGARVVPALSLAPGLPGLEQLVPVGLRVLADDAVLLHKGPDRAGLIDQVGGQLVG